MKFEVDNATERIANELQEAIVDSIRDIHDNQSNIIRMVDALDKKISTEDIEKTIKDVGKDISELSDSLDNIERSCEDSSSMIDGLKTKIDIILEYTENNNLEEINSSLQEVNKTLNSIDSKEGKTLSEINNLVISVNNSLRELSAIGASLKSIDSQLKDIKETEDNTNSSVHSNNLMMEELKNILETIASTSKLQAEKTDEIRNYLQKPGIARLFKGMGKDKDDGTGN